MGGSAHQLSLTPSAWGKLQPAVQEGIWPEPLNHRGGRQRMASSSVETCSPPSPTWKRGRSPPLLPSTLDPKTSSLLWEPAPFVECLAVLGSALPHNTHMPPPDNGQGPTSAADSLPGDWPSQWGLSQTTVESRPG